MELVSTLMMCILIVVSIWKVSYALHINMFLGLEYPLSDGKLRIVQNSSSNLNSGRLEIAYHGIWMPVCGKFFTKEAADVSCRQIGYSYAQSYCTNAWYVIVLVIDMLLW